MVFKKGSQSFFIVFSILIGRRFSRFSEPLSPLLSAKKLLETAVVLQLSVLNCSRHLRVGSSGFSPRLFYSLSLAFGPSFPNVLRVPRAGTKEIWMVQRQICTSCRRTPPFPLPERAQCVLSCKESEYFVGEAAVLYISCVS